jgi:hypothetical protein
VDTNIAFTLVPQSEDITLTDGNTTVNFADTGYYLLTLALTTDIEQVTAILTNTAGTQTTTYTLSDTTENKTLTAILEVTEAGTTMQIQNTLGDGDITAGTMTIVKIAEI